MSYDKYKEREVFEMLKYPDLILVGNKTYQGYASDDQIAQCIKKYLIDTKETLDISLGSAKPTVVKYMVMSLCPFEFPEHRSGKPGIYLEVEGTGKHGVRVPKCTTKK
jgi:hypothetical protein